MHDSSFTPQWLIACRSLPLRSLCCLLFLTAANRPYAADAPTPSETIELDAYGGWCGLETEATGFFRTQELNGRWWFISPDGHSFLSAGVNHVDYKQDYSEDFVRFVTGHLRRWGFNTIGWSQEIMSRDRETDLMVHSRGWGPDQYRVAKMPYVHLLRFTDIETYVKPSFPDVFSHEFEEHCERVARETCPQLADDPFLIGYCYSDAPNWPLWEQLVGRDRIAAVARRYYRVIHDAVRRYDRNHLLLGDRYKGDVSIAIDGRKVNGMAPELLDAMRDTVDVLSVEYYVPVSRMELDFDVWHELTGKPILIADSAFRAPTDALNANPDSPVYASDQAARGRAYTAHAERLYSNPLVIGYHWCAFGRSAGRKSGLLDGNDQPYEECVQRMAEFNTDRLYAVAMPEGDQPRDDVNDSDLSRDRFGATTAVRTEPTGFFHTREVDGRWWFVSPDGNAFLSIGMNHLDLAALHHADNAHIFQDRYAGRTDRFIREGIAAPLMAWGFNTIGWTQELVGGTWGKPGTLLRHSPEWDITKLRLAGLPFVYNFTFAEIEEFNSHPQYPDVFSQEFADWADYLARAACVELAREPLLLGYADVPVPDFTSGRPGSWSEGLDLDQPADLEKLQRIVRRYFEVVTAAIRRYDPHHLLFGPRFGHPSETPDWLIVLAGEYFDVILCNRFVTAEEVENDLSRWHRLSGRPILIADMAFLAPTDLLHVSERSAAYVVDQSARGEAYCDFAAAAFAHPSIVGFHWCAFLENRTRKSGLKTSLDEPYWDCIRPMQEFNRNRLYSIATERKPIPDEGHMP
ncbi:MAG: hypothetical protein AB7U20_24955 [Planctomycetaceae bacterium]